MNYPAVGGEFTLDISKIKVEKIVFVEDMKLSDPNVDRQDVYSLVDLFDFIEGGIGFSIWLNEAVAAEVSVVWIISVVTTIGPKFLSIGALFTQALVRPIDL